MYSGDNRKWYNDNKLLTSGKTQNTIMYVFYDR